MKTKGIRCGLLGTAILLLSSNAFAGQAEVAYSAEYQSAIDFGRGIIGPLSGGMGKWLGKLNNTESETAQLRMLEARFIPTEGPEAIWRSYANYCSGVGGVFFSGMCSNAAETEYYFYVRVLQAPPPATSALDVTVYESRQTPGTALLDIAAPGGYIGQHKRRQIDQGIQQRADSEAQRRHSLGVSTRAQVLERGTRVCLIEDRRCDVSSCFVEDSNPGNGKVKVAIGKQQSWYNVELWFACEE